MGLLGIVPVAQQHVRPSLGASGESTGWRFATAADKEALELWLRQHGAYQAHTDELLLASACLRLRLLRIELPAKGELERVVSAALNGFYQDVHRSIADGTSSAARTRIEELLKVIEPATVSVFEQIKSDPAKAGVDNLNVETGKLQIIRAVASKATCSQVCHGSCFNS